MAAQDGKRLRITLVKGLMGTKQTHRASVRGLGLRRRNQSVELPDTPAVRGMVNRVAYLLEVTESA
ncbi:MAG: 50S ribosomal protein L30 [Burkholderiales bacterium]|nr:50S ribosomal protein L30 [Burkholderiales bacterium]